MLSVKMRLTKAIRWSQVKSRDDAAEKLVSNEVKKALAEVIQLLENVSEQSSKSFLIYETLKMRKEVHQTKERRGVLEKPPEYSKENGKDDNDELRNIAAKFQQDGRNFAQDLWRQHSSSPELLRKPRMRRLPRTNSSLDNRRNTPMFWKSRRS